MAAVWTDVRRALRSLLRSKSFTAIAVLTLALSTGANTAMLSAFNALVLRTLPVEDPGRLILISARDARQLNFRPIYATAWTELGRHQQAFEDLEAYSGGALFAAEIGGRFTTAAIEAVSGGYYSLLGVRPFAGRLVDASDTSGSGDASPVVVLSHDFWRRAYHADADAIGQTLRVRGIPLTVIGITPPGFAGLRTDSGFDIAVPITLVRHITGTPSAPLRSNNLLGRLREGVDLHAARSELERVWPAVLHASMPPQLSSAEQHDYPTHRILLESASSGISALRARYSTPLRLLIILTALLLLVACVNVSALFLARAAAREHELAVCIALGAPHWRMFQHVFTETLILTIGGTLLGVPVAWWVTRWLARTIGASLAMPLAIELTPDYSVLIAALLVAVATGALVAALPSWTACRTDPNRTLRQSGRIAPAAGRWGRPLITAQIALSLILLFQAGLLGRTISNLNERDLGVPREGILAVRVLDQPGAYATLNRSTYYPQLVERLASIPGVQSVALNKLFPWLITDPNALESVARMDATDPEYSTEAVLEVVSPGFFGTAAIKLPQGRDFSWHDENGPPVVIVNATLAKRLFPHGDAVGQYIRIGTDPRRQRLTIVGVAADATLGNMRSGALPVAYRPWLQEPAAGRLPSVLLRTNAPGAVAPAVAETVESMGTEYVLTMSTVGDQLRGSIASERIAAALSAWFAILSGVLAVLGVYGVLAYSIARRAREIGIRVALGASRWIAVRGVVFAAVAMTLIGIAVGVPLALGASRATAALLFGVTASDVSLLTAAAAGLLAAGMAAALAPAYFAARIDPAGTLRSE